MQETWVLMPELGRCPGEGNGNPLQYSGLENSMGCIVHGVTEQDMTEQVSLSHQVATVLEFQLQHQSFQ